MLTLTSRPVTMGDVIEQLDPLAKTALWTASMRAREHDRSDRLFHDPLARVLAGEEGPTIMHSFEADVQGSVEDPALAVRTRFFDDALERITWDEGARQVILVAVGMDTRAFRMTWPTSTTLYELDRGPLLRLKDKILSASAAKPTCTRIPIEVDLTADWTGPLLDEGFNPAANTVWLAEGLFYFMTVDERDALVCAISELSNANSWLLADYVSQQQLESPTMRAWREQMANKNHAWKSGSDDPVSWLSQYGWSTAVTYYGEPDADYGRWANAHVAPGVSGTRGRYLIVSSRIH